MSGAGDSAAAVLLTSVLQRNSYVRLVMRALRFLTRRLQRWRPLGASVETRPQRRHYLPGTTIRANIPYPGGVPAQR
jgi:hypothetical protein